MRSQRISAQAGGGFLNPSGPLCTPKLPSPPAQQWPTRLGQGCEHARSWLAVGSRPKSGRLISQRSAKGLTGSPELHRSHGRSHAGVKGHEEGSTPPPRTGPQRGWGAWPVRSLALGGSAVLRPRPRNHAPPSHVICVSAPPRTHVIGSAILEKRARFSLFSIAHLHSTPGF